MDQKTNGIEVNLESKIVDVYNVFSKTFDKHKPLEVFLSFNGGKDCTVLLHLLKNYYNKNESLMNEKIHIFYIQPEKPFDEIEEFVKECEKEYDVQIEKVNGQLKLCLERICKTNKNLQAVIMGCRRTDPYCENLKTFHQTDLNWPPLMRINPLLDWTCKDIWDYIKTNSIPYCTLYDKGYTSIGDKTNTEKNPHLQILDSQGIVKYQAAYHLTDDMYERAGRL